ncbi:hypothetical protein N9Z78_03095, partial [Akkermansiaceae bacterium]|nr:hypothetical protein [Akkermansiaceae bacterium]
SSSSTYISYKWITPYLSDMHFVIKFPPYLNEVNYDVRDFHSAVILYTGDYFSNIRNLAETYKVCLENEIDLNIIGNSNLNLSEKKNIKIRARVSFGELQKYESACNINLVIGNLEGSQIPGKLFQCFGSTKPTILVCESSQYQFFVNEFGHITKLVICLNEYLSILKAIEKAVTLLKVSGILDEGFSSENVVRNLL